MISLCDGWEFTREWTEAFAAFAAEDRQIPSSGIVHRLEKFVVMQGLARTACTIVQVHRTR